MPPPESSRGLTEEGSRSFPRQLRLRRRAEFLAVQSHGRSLRSRHVVAVWIDNGLEHSRLGVTVSRRVGKAVERNRVKRWLRETFRHHKDMLPPGVDVVLIARAGSPQAGFRALRDEVVRLFEMISCDRCSGIAPRLKPKNDGRSST